jgi:signal transduction histidine kinase
MWNALTLACLAVAAPILGAPARAGAAIGDPSLDGSPSVEPSPSGRAAMETALAEVRAAALAAFAAPVSGLRFPMRLDGGAARKPWLPDHVGERLRASRRELAAGRFALARAHALVPERWGGRSGELEVVAQARLLSGLSLAALGELEEARAQLRPALVELRAAPEAVSPGELLEGELTLIRLDWLTGRDDVALAAWADFRARVEGAAAVAADLFLSEACHQASMPEVARIHARRALAHWRAETRVLDDETGCWCRFARSLGWAGSLGEGAACRDIVGTVCHLEVARGAFLAGDPEDGERILAATREAWPGAEFDAAPSLWPARLRLAIAREAHAGVEALIEAASARMELFGGEPSDLRRAWEVDWNASLAPWHAARAARMPDAAAIVEAAWTREAGPSTDPPPLLERRARLRAWLDQLAPDWMPLSLATAGPTSAPTVGFVWVPFWVRALGALGGLGLGVLGGVTLLQSRRSRRLELRLTELERARESLVREAAAMSHDLKSPVLTMRCALDLLGFDSDDPAIAARVAPLQQSMDHILRLADRSMELHLLRMPLGETLAESLDMVALTRSVVGRWTPLASEKRVELRFEADGVSRGSLPWKLPRDHAERLLDNLLSNAIKYSYVGGLVEVSLAEGRDARQGQGVLSVSDAGVGLREAELPSFFHPLSRLSSEPTDGEPSTGLGTAIIEAIATRYGGSAEVAARQDRSGLRVTVRWKLG